ncbi:MAG TPA: stalk domain-containing protein [Bacilli bacterium]
MGKRIWLRLAIGLRICVALFLVCACAGEWLPPSFANAAGISFTESPQGITGLSRPEIHFTITETDVAGKLIQRKMLLDGLEVASEFDAATQSLSYTPDSNLRPGKHTVEVILQYAGYEPFSERWEFTVSEHAVDKRDIVISPEQRAGLRALNDFRLLNGLKPVGFNVALVYAAQRHAHYLFANKVDADVASLHVEDPSGQGFIGRDIAERRNFVGYVKPVSEDVSFATGTLIQSIDALFDAPYHRIPFLMPSLTEVGIAKEGEYTVIEFGFSEAEQETTSLIVSPAPGDPGVPARFDGHEAPDPLRKHRPAKYPVGYPLMGVVSGNDVQSVRLVDYSLTDSSGKAMSLAANTPANDDHLQHEIILIPRNPLKPDTGYTASMTVEITHTDGTTQTLKKEWIFRTEGTEDEGKNLLHADAASYVQKLGQTDISRHVATFALNGDSYTLDGVKHPMKPPYLQDGSAYLWVRDLANALGAPVEWDNETHAAIYRKGGRTVVFFTRENTVLINESVLKPKTGALVKNDSTFIPVRLLSEALGCDVEYDGAAKTVTIIY